MRFLKVVILILATIHAALPMSFEVVNRKALIEPSKCQKSNDIVIMVHSKHDHFGHRETIRKTWGRDQSFEEVNPRVKRVFVLAKSDLEMTPEDMKPFEDEAESNGDVLFLDFQDTYRNLTYKHLSGYKWITENCPEAKYVVKTDDDVFVDMIHLPAYLSFYDLEANSPQFFLCYVIADQHPIRDPDHPRKKWFLTREEYSRDEFPNYCSGTAYVTNLATVENVLGRIERSLDPLFIDDVLVTGLAVEGAMPQIDILAWNDAFLANHMQAKEELMEEGSGYFSPELMAAFDLKPEEVEALYKKTRLCARQREECYDLLYKERAAAERRRPMAVEPKPFKIKFEL